MNFGKSNRRQNGNAMIYILMALALIGLLTATITRQDDSDAGDISEEQAELLATQILEYAISSQTAIDQLLMSGINPDNLDYALPSATSFNTAPFYKKLFHPQGGGLNYKPLNPSAAKDIISPPSPGFYIGKVGNVEWSPTTAPEIMFAAYQINEPVCKAINKKITGSTAIPTTSTDLDDSFLPSPTWVTSNVNLTELACPDCKGYSALCVARNAGDAFIFYSVILNR